MQLKKFFLSSSLKYLFNVLAVLIVIVSFVSVDIFKKTKDEVLKISTQSNIDYTKQIADNMADEIINDVPKDFYATLQHNAEKREHLEHFLSSFVTDKYKYIYLVDKKDGRSQHFRFLVDGSKEDKSGFGEIYMPFDLQQWALVYKTKEARYFQHKDLEDVWITYLKPIIVDDKIEAILVIDFSMSEQKKIEDALAVLTQLSYNAFMLFSFVFLLVLFFSYIDTKREIAKEKAYEKLQELNERLEKDVEQAIKETQEKEKLLQQQTRLAQMGEMISMIAHQWRQPLSSISSAAISIRMRIESGRIDFTDEKQRTKFLEFTLKKISNIGEYTQILSTTIDDFRNFFKSDKEKEKVSIVEPIERALFIVEASLVANNIKVIKDFQSSRSLHIYRNEVMQVILNIIKNAQDNFKERDIQNPQIVIATKENNGMIIISICDNGGGIDEEILGQIFDPYFSTKDEKNGSGLGLYMSKTMIEEHNNGSLYATNKEDGVCFMIVWDDLDNK